VIADEGFLFCRGAVHSVAAGSLRLRAGEVFFGALWSFAYYRGYKNLQYALYDIDGNGTNELLLGTGDSGYADKDDLIISIFTIQDGVAVQQRNVPSPTLLKNGTIWTGGESGSGIFHEYYRFEDGSLKLQTGISEYNSIDKDERGRFQSFPDGRRIDITEEEFERVRKEFEGDGQVVELDWKPLAEYGRE